MQRAGGPTGAQTSDFIRATCSFKLATAACRSDAASCRCQSVPGAQLLFSPDMHRLALKRRFSPRPRWRARTSLGGPSFALKHPDPADFIDFETSRSRSQCVTHSQSRSRRDFPSSPLTARRQNRDLVRGFSLFHQTRPARRRSKS